MEETAAIQKRMSDTFGIGNPINKEVKIKYSDDEDKDIFKGSKTNLQVSESDPLKS